MSDPFRVTLHRATLADMQDVAAAGRAEQRRRHPGYRVRVTADRLTLTFAGRGRTSSPWKLIATLEETRSGVLVTGSVRRRLATITWAVVTVVGVALTCLGITAGAVDGAANPGTWVGLVGGLLLVLVGSLNLLLGELESFSGAATAASLLRELFEPPEAARPDRSADRRWTAWLRGR